MYDVRVNELYYFDLTKCICWWRCYVYTAMPPPADIVKVAIEWPGANAQLIEMDQVCNCMKCDIRNASSLLVRIKHLRF